MRNKKINKKGLSTPEIILISTLVIAILVGGFVYYSIYIKPLSEQGFSCTADNQCNDNNLCTKDMCSLKTGICYNSKKTCPSGQICDITSGECKIVEIVNTNGANESSEQSSLSQSPNDEFGESPVSCPSGYTLCYNSASSANYCHLGTSCSTATNSPTPSVMDQIETAINNKFKE
jgi:hypothetical protein